MLIAVLELMGYVTPMEQAQIIQLYHASGALTNGEIPKEVLSQDQAYAFAKGKYNLVYKEIPDSLNFQSEIDAINWLNDRGQEQYKRLRPAGSERQQIDIDKWSHHADLINSNLDNLGFFQEVKPPSPEVHGLAILGGAQDKIPDRYQTAASLLNTGTVKPEGIYLLSGLRDLWAGSPQHNIPDEPILLDLLEERIGKEMRAELQASFDKAFSQMPNKSGESIAAARLAIVNQTKEKYHIEWPSELDMMVQMFKEHPTLQKYKFHPVNAPKIRVVEDGTITWKRPTTKTTVETLISEYELKGKPMVFISSQPYAKYQLGVIQSIMQPPAYIVQMAASADTTVDHKQKAVLGLEAFFSSVYSNKDRLISIIEGKHKASLAI